MTGAWVQNVRNDHGDRILSRLRQIPGSWDTSRMGLARKVQSRDSLGRDRKYSYGQLRCHTGEVHCFTNGRVRSMENKVQGQSDSLCWS